MSKFWNFPGGACPQTFLVKFRQNSVVAPGRGWGGGTAPLSGRSSLPVGENYRFFGGKWENIWREADRHDLVAKLAFGVILCQGIIYINFYKFLHYCGAYSGTVSAVIKSETLFCDARHLKYSADTMVCASIDTWVLWHEDKTFGHQ